VRKIKTRKTDLKRFVLDQHAYNCRRYDNLQAGQNRARLEAAIATPRRPASTRRYYFM
jgi:hypothetical protein